jgi:hypothetical protein
MMDVSEDIKIISGENVVLSKDSIIKKKQKSRTTPEYNRIYYLRNKERLVANAHENYEKNKETILAKKKEKIKIEKHDPKPRGRPVKLTDIKLEDYEDK